MAPKVTASNLNLRGRRLLDAILLAVVLLPSAVAHPVAAQELTPRAYWPAPRGTRVLIVGYAYSTGDVIIDPSLPIYGVSSDISRSQIAVMQTINLAGRTANLILEAPYAWGSTRGTLAGLPASVNFSGLGDVGATLSLNLLGAPTMSGAEFQALRRKPRPILGASLKIVAPTGQYDPGKVINIGANRWAVKLELGQILPLKPKWLLELELGAWLLGDNDDFLGRTRKQAPIIAAEIHLVKRFKPGRWAALEVNFFEGGQSTIGGEELDDIQRNSNIGATLLWTLEGRHAVKISLSTGLFATAGGEYGTALISYLLRVN
jgi:hypothetical protein